MKKTSTASVLIMLIALGACASNAKKGGPDAQEATELASADTSKDAPEKAKKRARIDPNAVNAGPCPAMGVLYDASRVIEFDGTDERFASIAWTGEMRGVRGLCRYVGEEPIVMNLKLNLAFGRGPMAQGNKHTYRYWVAVTRKDRLPLSKQYFEIPVTFSGGADREALDLELERIVIPRANENVAGGNFEILVGFDLTEPQLAFNRAGKRFRVNAGQ